MDKTTRQKHSQPRHEKFTQQKVNTEELVNVIYEKIQLNPAFHQTLNDAKNQSIKNIRRYRSPTGSPTSQIPLKEIIEAGIKGQSSPEYEQIKKYIRDEDPSLGYQLRTHETRVKHVTKSEKYTQKKESFEQKADKHYEKTPVKKIRRKPKVTVEETTKPGTLENPESVGIEKKLVFKTEKEVVKLKRGERNRTQVLMYQSIHQPKNLMKQQLVEAENKEGNEGVQLAHKMETQLKEKVVKPWVRNHIGFDRHQYKEAKLLKKSKIAQAKSDLHGAIARVDSASNPLSRAFQKRRIKKEIYKKHRLHQSLGSRLKEGLLGIAESLNPLTRIKNQISVIIAAIGAIGGMIQFLIVGIAMAVVLFIPIIVISYMLTFFFGFNNTDPLIEISKMSIAFQENIVNIQKELLDADIQEQYDKAEYRVDEVRLSGSITASARELRDMQVQALAYVAALYQEELNEEIGTETLKQVTEDLFKINQRYKKETKEDCHTVITETGSEEVCTKEDHWVLILSLEKGDLNEYALNQLKSLPDEKREFALFQYGNYTQGYGMGQPYGNPFNEDFDWRERVTSPFGYRVMSDIVQNRKELHSGLDVGIPEGTEIYAIADGTVTVSYDPTSGNYVNLKPTGQEDTQIVYAHLKKGIVSTGQTVKKGDLIAYSGNTGRSTGPHLHLGIRKGTTQLNPLFMIQFPITETVKK